jgi:hypothetical protein
MSGYYGSFLKEGTDAHKAYYSKYIKRSESVLYIAEHFKEKVEEEYDLKGKIHINYQSVYIAMGRYYNDVHKFKMWHNIELTHRSKIVAYMLKWIRLNPIFFHSITQDDWMKLNETSRFVLLNMNQAMLNNIIRYVSECLNSKLTEQKLEGIKQDLNYYIKTDGYDERMGSLWFQEVL